MPLARWLPGVISMVIGGSGLLMGMTRVPVPPAAVNQVEGWRVNVREAESAELQLLPGIGRVIAGRIRSWQSSMPAETGRAETILDLLTIKGIGPRTIERLRPFIEGGVSEGPVVHD